MCGRLKMMLVVAAVVAFCIALLVSRLLFAKEVPMSRRAHTNGLIHSKSPYLLQHAHNPVDWHPWTSEALEKAMREDKPIFLSIGYSACHWCHVMERESFENKEIAELMNKYFVSIKVDREERPDLDEVYMTAVQMMTGQGGWPLSVFLTPDLKPFFGGTYWPPEDRYGRAGFKRVLTAVAQAYRNDREKIVSASRRISEALNETAVPAAGTGKPLSDDLIKETVKELASAFDPRWGGFGGAPKFPSAPSIHLLLRHYRRTGEKNALNMAVLTLDQMARGGMYDHLGGGFHRYSVDERWLVPHFEKMLYDNAQLATLYAEACKVTGRAMYARVVRETLDYVLREMTGEEGGFFSTQDADSEGVEGTFYVWTPKEIDAELGEEDGALFRKYYGVTEQGNFEGKNILHLSAGQEEFATGERLNPKTFPRKMDSLKRKLFKARLERARPATDDKILTDWNGLMITAFARGYRLLDDERYKRAAVRATGFLLKRMYKDGRLLHAHRGGASHIDANLADYAFLAQALLDVYEATFDVRWVTEARALAEKMIVLFQDARSGAFFSTPADRKDIIARRISAFDGSIPSANAVAAHVLLKLGDLTGTEALREKGRETIRVFAPSAERAPRGFARLLCALDYAVGPTREIVVVGPASNARTAALLKRVFSRYVPNTLLHRIDTTADGARDPARVIPSLAFKTTLDGAPAAYVCVGKTCSAPVTSVKALEKLLGGSDKGYAIRDN